jgi:hypothetical protein
MSGARKSRIARRCARDRVYFARRAALLVAVAEEAAVRRDLIMALELNEWDHNIHRALWELKGKLERALRDALAFLPADLGGTHRDGYTAADVLRLAELRKLAE